MSTPSTAHANDNKLVDQTMGAILAVIQDEALAIGQSLPGEHALALRLGVSRTVIREANRAMAALGILDIANGRAARVGAPSQAVLETLIGHALRTRHSNIIEALEVRRTLEVRIAALAAARRSGMQAEAICGHAEAMRQALKVPEQMMAADLAFHRTIAEAAGNPLLALLIAGFEPVTRTTWPKGWAARTDRAQREAMLEVHEEIARAILARDPGHAERAMARHFDDTLAAINRAGIE